MDFLDPKKQLQHRIMLYLGYVLIAIAIVIGTVVLKYQAYGFGLGKNGTVIQNGLLYFSSQPHPAAININSTIKNVQTNTRLSLPAGIYTIQLKRDGYREWRRMIELDGGSVERFDYPFLFPVKLATKTVQNYSAAPALAVQSPDRRWLLVSQPNSPTTFSLSDMKNPDKPPTTIALPAGVASKAAETENWQLEEWSDDNQHLVLAHTFDGKVEYVLLDRANPEQSLNISQSLAASPSKLTLKDKKYDQYYLYNAADQSVVTATLKTPAPQQVLSRAAAYQSYGNDTFLYVTDSGAPAGKVLVKLAVGSQVYPIRSLPSNSTYLLDLTKYNGTFYVAAGAASGDKVYIYKDPVGQLNNDPQHAVVPVQVLHVAQPSYLSFSSNAQFIMAESGTKFGVYDIENKTGYNYSRTAFIDPPQVHAVWMDGHRLAYVSQGKLTVFDYDNNNSQTLESASSAYLPFFSPNYKIVENIAPTAAASQFSLTQTPLTTPADK